MEGIPVVRFDVAVRDIMLVGGLESSPFQAKEIRKLGRKRWVVSVHVVHATLQTRLNGIGVPPEDIHDECPTTAGKDRPCVLSH